MSEYQDRSTLTRPGPGEVHLWHFDLDAPAEDMDRYRALLNREEQERAARLIREIHRERFIVGRARLRLMLGRYLSQAPESIEFTYCTQGKPALAPCAAATPFAFNLSHSASRALCAVAGFDTVGVDLEAVKESRDLLPIARRFFSEAERAQLMALPEAQQCPAFYQCWSSKEALLKAWGTGLATPLDKFSVVVAPGKAEVIRIDLPEWARTPWRLYPLEVPTGFAAALATPGVVEALHIRPWTAWF